MRGLRFYLILLLPCWHAAPMAAEEEYTLPPMHHPVEIAIPESMQVAEGLPLDAKGEMVCDTCHGIEDLQEIPLDEVDIDDPDFLNLGPYPILTDFCYRCHEEQGHERYNLHQMLDEKGEVDERGCVYCHVETPDPSKADQVDDLEFRLPKAKLCYGCHLKTPHLNTLSHQVEPDEKIREVMDRAEEEHQIHLPLDEAGKVTCITCHSPHPAGLIDPDRPAGKVVEDGPIEDGIAYRRTAWSQVFARDKSMRLLELHAKQGSGAVELAYQRVEKEILLRQSAKDGKLCLSCHEFED
ncbi:MAG: hypothetical protein ABW098_19770 [Candidatus Thiodiazotropha sp.]